MHKLLVAKGFLPQELPPLFSSESMVALVSHSSLPSAFTGAKAQWTQPVNHNLARAGGLRRRLTIPNPVNFFRLAREFEAHQAMLAAKWAQSTFSQTTPNLTGAGRRAIAPTPSDRARARAFTRVGARYVLCADISQFYPSIYSHSVPWAMHTKADAKANIKNPTLPGNVLDREIQACQYGQTKGIAIGPDTSLGIAELLLSPIDARLKAECKIIGGVRFIDDIELTFRTLAEADHALARLEGILSEFELQLNATKTRIVELPDHIESAYVTTLRGCIPDPTNAYPTDWIDYFNRAFLAARSNPQDGVLRYAVAALQKVKITPSSWPLAQNLLWQCISIDPGCIRFVVDVLVINRVFGHKVDTSTGSLAVNSLIQTGAAVGHGSEVLWSIWAVLILGLTVSIESQVAISQMEDALVAAAALVARDRKVFSADFDSSLWKSWFVDDCFDQEHWLFVYEALIRGWCPAEVASCKIAAAACPVALSAAKVTFLNTGLIDTYVPWKLLQFSGGSGGGY